MKRREDVVRSELAYRGEEITKELQVDLVVMGFSNFGGAYRKAKEVQWTSAVVDPPNELWEYHQRALNGPDEEEANNSMLKSLG